MSTIRLPAVLENLSRIIQCVSAFAEQRGFHQKRIQEIELATEEALVNVMNYAYPDDLEGEVEVCCEMDNVDRLSVIISDNGVPFDLLSAADPDLEATIATRPIGGLGIFLIKKVTDDVQYKRVGDLNTLSLVFRK